MDTFTFPPGDDDDDCECPPADTPTLSPRDLEMVLSAERDLTAALTEMQGITDDIYREAMAELHQVEADAEAEIAAISGQADLDLSSAEYDVTRVIDKTVTEATRTLNSTLDELFGYGVTAPYSVGAMRDSLAGDPTDMVIEYVPQIREWITAQTGVSLPPTAPPPPGLVPYPVPVPFGNIPPTPGPVPPVPPIPGTVPPYPPPNVPPSSPPTTATVPGTPGTSCPDVNVTVNVPPIMVQYPPGMMVGGSNLPPAPPGNVPPSPPPDVPPTAPPPPGYPPPPGNVPPPTAPPTIPPPPGGTVPPTPVNVPTAFPPSAPGVPSAPDPLQIGLNGQYLANVKRKGLDWNKLTTCAAVEKNPPIMPPSLGVGGAVGRAGKPDDPKTLYVTPFHQLQDMLKVPETDWSVIGKVYKAKFGDATFSEVSDKLVDVARDNTLGRLMTPDSVRNYGSAMEYGGQIAIARKAEEKTGFPATYFFQGETYAMQYDNPMYLPTQSEVNNVYLTNQINSTQWECWTRALGSLPDPARLSLLSSQSKPGVADIVQLFFRGNLSPDQFLQRMREVGVLDPTYAKEWVEVSKVLPTMTDLLRFMVRDADDPSVVEQYRLDEQFDQKYGGQIQKWAGALGLPQEVFRYFWRSHWEIPSNTQLYEMLQRLRPDRPEVTDFAVANPDIRPGNPEWAKRGGPLVVTQADVKRALQVNDMMPGWVDPEVAISYRPITRTDAVRAYEIGAFDDDKLYHALRDGGYNEQDARTLLDYFKQLKARRKSNVTGVWSIRKIVKYYKAGSITRDEAVRFMAELIPDMSGRLAVLSAAEQELGAEQRQREIRALKRGFMLGEYDADGARHLLLGYGVGAAQATYMLSAWTTERDSRYKQPTVTQLTGWMTEGLITAEECHRRLVNLGYSRADAEKIVELAVMKSEAHGGMTAEQAGGVFGQAITNARNARAASETTLTKRLGAMQREVVRIMSELSRRRENAGQPPLEDVILGPRR